MDVTRSARAGEELVRKFGAALRGAQLYAPAHPLVKRSLDALAEAVRQLLIDYPGGAALGVIDDEIVVADAPLPKAADTYAELIRRLQALGIERIGFEPGVTPDELRTLVLTLAHPERRPGDATVGAVAADPAATLQALPHIRVGRITVEDKPVGDMAAMRRLYTDAVAVAGDLWNSAQVEGLPDPDEARRLIESLAQAVAQNRTALIALTALKDYDNYTFTHMVNVSILTMAQARAVGVDGNLLRELGIAALMHDIGKIRTPLEILQKPDKLTDSEFAIMRMHVVDGAEILRHTPQMPALAAVVAFEHHLRLDGQGYPNGVKRQTLNLGTMLCSIADVYDAMRSQRVYQESFPTDRVLEVLKRNDGHQFDQHLVRRFSQLMGIYPPGNLVRLNTGEVGVVMRIHAPDPSRPRVRVVIGRDGEMLPQPYDVNLWETSRESASPSTVVAPVDPASAGVDPLTYL